MCLPYVTQKFSTNSLMPSLVPGHYPFGSRQNSYSHTAVYAGYLFFLNIDSQPRFTYPLQTSENRLIPILIFDINFNTFVRFFSDNFKIFDEAFFLQNLGNCQFQS